MEFLSLFNLNSRDVDQDSEKSRALKDAVKSGRIEVIKKIPPFIINSRLPSNVLNDFLNNERILVPVPRSTLIVSGGIFPSLEICQVFQQHGWGHSVEQLVKRTTPLRKSSEQTGADNRPSIIEHINSISIENKILATDKITLIDDVLTLGRTSTACYLKLKDTYPNMDIKLVAVSRTKNIEHETFYTSNVGTIIYNPSTQKSRFEAQQSYPLKEV